MLRCASLAVAMLLAAPSLQAAWVLNDYSAYTEDFSGFSSDFTGFTSSPSSTQLDSDYWKTLGLSDGKGTWGGTHDSGDFARGTSTGGKTTGGFYVWDVGGGVRAAGWQPTDGDATPGNLVLWVRNGTGGDVTHFDVSFDRWVRNDQNRSSSLNFGFSTSDPTAGSGTGTVVDAFNTAEAADDMPAWQSASSGLIRFEQTVADNDYMFLIWSTDDAGGVDDRDEFGISNVSVSALIIPEPGTIGLLGLSLSVAALLRKRRSR